jgi:hypothetical protein
MIFWLFSGLDQKSGALICSWVRASWDLRAGASKIAPHSVCLLAERNVLSFQFVEGHSIFSLASLTYRNHQNEPITREMARLTWPLATLVAGLCLLWTMLGLSMLPMARSADFLNFYAGASLVEQGRIAELHTVQTIKVVKGRMPEAKALFVRPAFYAALLAPLAWLPQDLAFDVWVCSQALLLVLCWLWAWRRFGPDALVFAALSLPAPLGIASAQDCGLLLVAFIASYELAERKRWAASGAALALLLIKFHLILLWPVALLLQKRWKMFAGFCGMAAVEVVSCWLLGGTALIRSYVKMLGDKHLDILSPSPQLMISYEGLAANLGINSPAFNLLLIGGIVVLFVWTVRGAPLWRMFAVTAVASELIVPHVYGYDATLLLLPIWLTIFHSTQPSSRIAATLMATPLPFLFALADKPWAIVSSASMLLFFVVLSCEKVSSTAERRNVIPAHASPMNG